MYSATAVDPHDEEGKIRIRFETLSQRLQKINVDILHKSTNNFYLQSTVVQPETGELGCFVFDELERLKTLDMSTFFKR